ncbi:MAG: glycosyltransferase, partial [Bacteroidota bacterium]
MKEKDFPIVSVLVAVRNEENCIVNCLNSLIAQDYPQDRFEVLIGDDQSEDDTANLVSAKIKNRTRFKLLTINRNCGKTKGKANVLAQLAQEAKGTYFIITDADMQLPTNWISGMVNEITDEIGVVTGCTIPMGSSSLDALQAIDWIKAQAQIYLLSKINIPVTSLGNNMLV